MIMDELQILFELSIVVLAAFRQYFTSYHIWPETAGISYSTLFWICCLKLHVLRNLLTMNELFQTTHKYVQVERSKFIDR